MQVVDDAELRGVFDHLLHADRLGDADGHQVARLLDADAQGGRTQEVAAIVLRSTRAAGPGPWSIAIGASRMTVEGVKPLSSAAR